jgi:hypothetical protein
MRQIVTVALLRRKVGQEPADGIFQRLTLSGALLWVEDGVSDLMLFDELCLRFPTRYQPL